MLRQLVGDDDDVLHVETELAVKISFVKDIDKPIKFWTRTKFMSGTDQKDGGDPAKIVCIHGHSPFS